MPVEINVTKKDYVFINPENGQPLTAEEFAKKYPRVAIGRHALEAGSEGRAEGGKEAQKV